MCHYKMLRVTVKCLTLSDKHVRYVNTVAGGELRCDFYKDDLAPCMQFMQCSMFHYSA